MHPDRTKTVFRFLLTASFVAVGVAHFTHTDSFVHIMPPYLPFHEELVLISGFFEIAGGVAVQIPRLRRVAGVGLLTLLVAVYPANIHMAVNEVPAPDGTPIHPALLWGRLPLQFLFMAWVWWVTLHRGQSREGQQQGEERQRVSA